MISLHAINDLSPCNQWSLSMQSMISLHAINDLSPCNQWSLSMQSMTLSMQSMILSMQSMLSIHAINDLSPCNQSSLSMQSIISLHAINDLSPCKQWSLSMQSMKLSNLSIVVLIVWSLFISIHIITHTISWALDLCLTLLYWKLMYFWFYL